MDTIIEVRDVSFTYADADEPALRDVSLNIADGDFVGVIGPSGAGKSTLASALSGAVPHHFQGSFFGAVMVGGKDTCEASLTDISKVVGSVLQDIDAQMVASMVEDEMLFGLENFGVPHDQIESRIQETLETVGIADLRHRDIATLSGGQKQKVAIAAILAMRPRVLVLDEPTAALDPVSSETVFETLRTINREAGVTVVVIEQKVALLSRYCKRVVVLDHGSIALEGTPHEVFGQAERLRSVGVDSPRTVRVSNSLAALGICPGAAPALDVDEAASLIKPVLPGGDGSLRRAPSASRSPHAPAHGARDGQPVLELSHVSFAYPGTKAAVRDIDLAVYPGELLGVIGQNGAGKTTMTKLVTGLLKPSEGMVRICGLDNREARTSQIARHASTLFQNPDRQICRPTVLEEVAFGLELTGTDPTEARERARVAATRFGLPLDEAPFSLSRGQRQMVALASVVVMEPELVILDEPTSGLDYRECMTVMETVSEMAGRGSAVIMVCHDMEVVSDFASRLAVMADGRILAEGPVHEVFADARLMAKAFITPPQVIELADKLSREVSPAFAGIHEVSDIVACVKELVDRG